MVIVESLHHDGTTYGFWRHLLLLVNVNIFGTVVLVTTRPCLLFVLVFLLLVAPLEGVPGYCYRYVSIALSLAKIQTEDENWQHKRSTPSNRNIPHRSHPYYNPHISNPTIKPAGSRTKNARRPRRGRHQSSSQSLNSPPKGPLRKPTVYDSVDEPDLKSFPNGFTLEERFKKYRHNPDLDRHPYEIVGIFSLINS